MTATLDLLLLYLGAHTLHLASVRVRVCASSGLCALHTAEGRACWTRDRAGDRALAIRSRAIKSSLRHQQSLGHLVAAWWAQAMGERMQQQGSQARQPATLPSSTRADVSGLLGLGLDDYLDLLDEVGWSGRAAGGTRAS